MCGSYLKGKTGKMEDVCFLCAATLATVELSCGHRLCCQNCHEDLQRRSNGRATCPVCRQSIFGTRDTTTIQLQPATLQSEIQFPRERYPFGALLVGETEGPRIANADVLRVVKEAVEATRAGSLTYSAFRKALDDRLTVSQREMALVYLHSDVDCADVVQHLQLRQNTKTHIQTLVPRLVNKTVHGADGQAIFLRAAVQTAFNVGAAVAEGIDSLASFTRGDCITGVLVLAIFSAVEVYRCSTGHISVTDFQKNLGEHVVGTLGSLGASYLLAASSATLTGPFGIFIAAVVGGLLADSVSRGVYRLLFPAQIQIADEELHSVETLLEPIAIAREAGATLNINLDVQTFEEAQLRFRRYLLSVHPDKNPNASPERMAELQEKTRVAIACWAIVREHYRSTVPLEEIEEIDEGYLVTNVLKVYDAVTENWTIVRTWFGDLNYEPREGERVDTVTLYF